MTATPITPDPDAPVYMAEHHTPDRTLRASLDLLPDGSAFVTVAAESRRTNQLYTCVDLSADPLAHLDATLGVLAGLRAAVVAQMAGEREAA